ncbi:MAG: hypothetical protein AAF225_14030, partial [Pseudomonadota bacterium]
MSLQRKSVSRSILSALLLSTSIIAPAAADDFTWTGGSGNETWNDAGNWINDTPGGTATFPGVGDSVTFNVSATVGGGTATGVVVGNGETLLLSNGQSTTLEGAVSGLVGFETSAPTASRADLGVRGTLTLNNGAELAVNEDARVFIATSGANVINNGTVSFENTGTSTASLGGRYQVDTTNAGLIDFISSGFVFDADVTQDVGGLVRLADGVSTTIIGAIDQTLGGSIQLGENSVLIGASNVTGGSIDMASTGNSFLGGSTLNGVTLTGNGIINNASSITAIDSTVEGILGFGTSAATASRADLGIGGTLTIANGGELAMNEDGRVFVSSSGAGIVNDGTISFQNTGTTTASLGGQFNVGTTNNGLMDFLSSGFLVNTNITQGANGVVRLADGITTSINGTVNQQAGGRVELGTGTVLNGGVTVTDGEVRMASTGESIFRGTFNDVTFTGSGVIENSASATITNGTIEGKIDFGTSAATASRADLGVGGVLSVANGGELALNEDSRVFVASSGANVVNDGTISFRNTGTTKASLGGQYNVSTTNNGLINVVSGVMESNTNVTQGTNGVLRVADGATYQNNGTVNQQAGGRIELGNGSSLTGSTNVVGGDVQMSTVGQ